LALTLGRDILYSSFENLFMPIPRISAGVLRISSGECVWCGALSSSGYCRFA